MAASTPHLYPKDENQHQQPQEQQELLPAWVNPDLDRLLVVRRGTKGGDFSSYAESLVELSSGALFARITGVTPKYAGGPNAARTYSSIQVSRTLSVELNSDLLYLNHSCDPTLEVDTAAMEVRVAAGKRIRKGDALTYFYPSTEAEIAQPFDCLCGSSEKCLGRIRGARELGPERLKGYFLNQHIRDLFEMEDGGIKKANGDAPA